MQFGKEKAKIILDNFKVMWYDIGRQGEKMDKLFTVKEAAEMLKKTPQGIHWLIKAGRLKPVSVAGKYKFFSKEGIDEYRNNRAK